MTPEAAIAAFEEGIPITCSADEWPAVKQALLDWIDSRIRGQHALWGWLAQMEIARLEATFE